MNFRKIRMRAVGTAKAWSRKPLRAAADERAMCFLRPAHFLQAGVNKKSREARVQADHANGR
jgi:hypothetical protein